MIKACVAAIAVSFFLSGCVTRAKYDAAMQAAAARLHDQQQKDAADLASKDQRIGALQADVARLQKAVDDRDRQIGDAQVQYAALQKKVDDAQALSEQLRLELKKAGKNVDQLLAESGQMHKALDDQKARLEELRKAQEAAQKRAELLKKLQDKFKKLVDAGDLKVTMREGRMVLLLRNDVLFDSGRTELKREGKQALKEVAAVLATIGDRKFQVIGHTDDKPISTERFPSNWELSAARAISVVKLLIAEGVRPDALSAAGYGQYDPIAANDSDDGRARNRRIEIVLQPNLSELVGVAQ